MKMFCILLLFPFTAAQSGGPPNYGGGNYYQQQPQPTPTLYSSPQPVPSGTGVQQYGGQTQPAPTPYNQQTGQSGQAGWQRGSQQGWPQQTWGQQGQQWSGQAYPSQGYGVQTQTYPSSQGTYDWFYNPPPQPFPLPFFNFRRLFGRNSMMRRNPLMYAAILDGGLDFGF